mmetsp:Transcript_26527/g.48072  ORF Transcript_26527/g.48072 Transcript_26527/m.48072 type:complete len:81 (+) Transcript_26527:125-367(+)
MRTPGTFQAVIFPPVVYALAPDMEVTSGNTSQAAVVQGKQLSGSHAHAHTEMDGMEGTCLTRRLASNIAKALWVVIQRVN